MVAHDTAVKRYKSKVPILKWYELRVPLLFSPDMVFTYRYIENYELWMKVIQEITSFDMEERRIFLTSSVNALTDERVMGN